MIVDEQPELLHEVNYSSLSRSKRLFPCDWKIVDENLKLTLFLLACDKGWDDVVEHLLNNHSKNTDINQANRVREVLMLLTFIIFSIESIYWFISGSLEGMGKLC